MNFNLENVIVVLKYLLKMIIIQINHVTEKVSLL